MTQLVVETSSSHCLLALLKGKDVLVQSIFLHQNALSSTLVPTIETLLNTEGLRPQDLSSIAIGIGPGSYTGTRVGVAVGKTLGFALGIPTYGFCSLLAFLPEALGDIALIMANRAQQFYLLRCTRTSENTCISHTGLVTEEELLRHIHGIPTLCASAPLPPALKEFPIVPLTPHVARLASYLHEHSGTLNSGDELIYLSPLF